MVALAWGPAPQRLPQLMPLHIVRLGTPRVPHEGVRIGTVRRPPRGVPKAQFGSGNWYDVWYPNLAPSAPLVSQAFGADSDQAWQRFARAYRAEMKQPDASRTLDLLAALSHQTNFSLGCYCEQESHCHRSILRQLLEERGADIA
jgi:uncharacterized protein YeaO (DUF488 family)